MNDSVDIPLEQYRLLVAMRYLNCSEEIWKGLKRQQGINNFHFLVTLRSFIEYTRRGIWFLAWANKKSLRAAEKATFQRPQSPGLVDMDKMINTALGLGSKSYLEAKLAGINEPFVDCLHALTHGNPISVRMTTIGLDKIFDTNGILSRVDLELNLFRVLLYRRILGEELEHIWKALSPICHKPEFVLANVRSAALLLKKSGNPTSTFLQTKHT